MCVCGFVDSGSECFCLLPQPLSLTVRSCSGTCAGRGARYKVHTHSHIHVHTIINEATRKCSQLTGLVCCIVCQLLLIRNNNLALKIFSALVLASFPGCVFSPFERWVEKGGLVSIAWVLVHMCDMIIWVIVLQT